VRAIRVATGAAVALVAAAAGASWAQGGGFGTIQSAPVPPGHAFYFTRGIYTGFGGRRFGSWATDWPKADRQFLIGLTRLTKVDAYDGDNAVRLDDPELRRFPLLYMVEVGRMDLTEPEVLGLRGYLEAGGMLFVDDFWGAAQWANFEANIRRVLPEYPIVELAPEHPVRRGVYTIDTIVQVPNIGNGCRGGPTGEYGGNVPYLLGMSDDRGRLLVLISYNSDLGDAWEWAEQPCYPLPFSNYAYRLGVNAVVYGMTH